MVLNIQKIEDYLKNGVVYVWRGTFAIAKVKRPIEGAFAVVQDRHEITVVIEESKLELQKENILEVDRDWKIITFDMLLPLDMVGFIAGVSNSLAQEGISVLWVSAYSTDHVLVQSFDLEKTLKKLQSLGCRIKEK